MHDTPAVLRRWAADDSRVTVTCADLSDPVNPGTRCPARAERMAAYRRRCQEGVLSACAGFDFAVIVDLDILGGRSSPGSRRAGSCPRATRPAVWKRRSQRIRAWRDDS